MEKAYKEFLEISPEMEEWRDKWEGKESEYGEYQLGYVDDDDIPELFVMDASAEVYYSMYTYRNGKVICAASQHAFSYEEKSNYLRAEYYGMWGDRTIYICSFDDGGLLFAGQAFEGPAVKYAYSDFETYRYNGVDISEEEFYSRWYSEGYSTADNAALTHFTMTRDELYAILDN